MIELKLYGLIKGHKWELELNKRVISKITWIYTQV